MDVRETDVQQIQQRLTRFRGCLLGLAIGDAMGRTVDDRSMEEIRGDFGPGGLQGYNEVNGYTEVTSHTQLAAYGCNGLLLGLTQGQLTRKMAPYVRYIRLAEREWAAGQHRSTGRRRFCWVGDVPEFQHRHCMDNRMLGSLIQDTQGSMEEPKNRFLSPGAVAVPVPVGLFYNPDRISLEEVRRLGAEAVALTHGSPLAFLTGAFLAGLIARLAWDAIPLKSLVLDVLNHMDDQFGREYPLESSQLRTNILQAMDFAAHDPRPIPQVLEQMGCQTMPDVVAGALFVCLKHPKDFDATIVSAVNHSGRSAAVGAVAGAIQGAILGVGALSDDFYLKPLPVADSMRELATDMCYGCPMVQGSNIYDVEWVNKYAR